MVLLIRILCLLLALLVVALLIVPKTRKSIMLENNARYFFGGVIVVLLTIFFATLYQYKDALWHNQQDVTLITRKIRQFEEEPPTIKLTNFDFKNLAPQTIVATLLEQPTLAAVWVSGLQPENVDYIIKIIQGNRNITILKLEQLQPASYRAILTQLENSAINTLEISRCRTDVHIITDLITLLQNNPAIANLSLEYAKLDDQAAKLLINYLIQAKQLKSLSLANNKITNNSYGSLKQLINNTKLQQLNLINNKMSRENATELQL